MKKLFSYIEFKIEELNANCLIKPYRDIKCIIKKHKNRLVYKTKLYYYM